MLVTGYLMHRYNWAMLKSLQFVYSRLITAYNNHNTLIIANHKLNINMNSNNIYNNNIHSSIHNNNSNNIHNNNNIYSKILTHIIP